MMWIHVLNVTLGDLSLILTIPLEYLQIKICLIENPSTMISRQATGTHSSKAVLLVMTAPSFGYCCLIEYQNCGKLH